jgi:hypothetical protein
MPRTSEDSLALLAFVVDIGWVQGVNQKFRFKLAHDRQTHPLA